LDAHSSAVTFFEPNILHKTAKKGRKRIFQASIREAFEMDRVADLVFSFYPLRETSS